VAPSLARFYDEMSELVRLADRSGWDRAWISEHHFHYYGGATPNPAIQLAAWARETERIRNGPAISLMPLRNPLHVAEDYAVVDQLSGGRLDFGIGRGYLPHEFEGHGLDADAVSAMREEGFEIIRRAWSGETFAHRGPHYRFPKLRLHPLPAQAEVPIWVAASRTRDSFEWAGRNGFNIMLNQYPVSPEESRERFGWYLDAWAEAGHPAGGHEAMMSVFLHIADSEEQAVAEARRAVQEHANLFRLLFAGDQWNEDYAGDESVFDFLAPDGDILAMFRARTCIGTAEQVIERIERYRDWGFTEMSFIVRTGELSHQQALATMARFNDEVLPAFR
jgi:natural product biosynthesis luciferase-like monooxygenase protein